MCADRLPVLVKWAEDQERMENSPKMQPSAHGGELHNPGPMHERKLCQGCATDLLGVVY